MESPRELAGTDLAGPGQFLREVVEACRPVVIRGLVGKWPVVEAGERSARDFANYLSMFDAGGQTEAFLGHPAIAGKYYYNDDLRGFNFERRRMKLVDALDALVHALDKPGSRTIYIGSVPANDYLPGFAGENPMRLLAPGVGPRIWLGTCVGCVLPLRHPGQPGLRHRGHAALHTVPAGTD